MFTVFYSITQCLQLSDIIFEAGFNIVFRGPTQYFFCFSDHHRLFRRSRLGSRNDFHLEVRAAAR